jgi:hypothetical protein
MERELFREDGPTADDGRRRRMKTMRLGHLKPGRTTDQKGTVLV